MLLLQLFVTAIDVTIFYLITYALLHKKFEFSFATAQARKRTIRTYGSGIIATLVITLSFFVGGASFHQFISISVFTILIKVISSVVFRHVIAIHITIFIMLGLAQALALLFFLVFNIDLTSPLAFVLGQILSFFIIVITCYKLRLHKILWFLEERPTLKISLFILTAILLTVLLIVIREETLIYMPYYFLMFGLLIIAVFQVLLGIGQRLKPVKAIEVKEIEFTKQDIVQLIDDRQEQLKGNIILDRFNYISHHAYMTIPQLSQLIILLLDHATKVKPQYPIILGISVIHNQLQLIVKHECSEWDYKALRKWSTVKHIKKVVQRYKGVIVLQHTYERAYETEYAIIIIKI